MMTRAAAFAACALALVACASFGHWSPAAMPEVAALCAVEGDVTTQLDALAAEYGVPPEFVRAAFAAACADTRSKAGGIAGARASALAARRMGARFARDGGAR